MACRISPAPSKPPSLIFAQHYAEQAARYDAAAWQRLQGTYGAQAANDILAHIRVITFANLYGNTFYALLEHLKFRPAQGSRFFDELAVLSAGAAVVPASLFVGMMAHRATAAFQRRTPRPNHD